MIYLQLHTQKTHRHRVVNKNLSIVVGLCKLPSVIVTWYINRLYSLMRLTANSGDDDGTIRVNLRGNTT